MSHTLSFLAALLLAIGVVLALAVFVAMPAAQHLSGLEDEIADLELQRDRLSTRLARPPELQKTTYVDEALITAASSSQAHASLQRIVDAGAQSAGARIKSFRIQPVEELGVLLRVASIVEIETNMSGLRDLLYRLEANRPYVLVERITIQRGRTIDSAPETKLSLQLEISGMMRPPL